ncbi:MAG: delta-60 repeat domain-containing protein [Planctomycetaceae bacterium]|nr:delta-60 repeat domain-containing protein [Planctomycetaceae bacterium]
MVRFARALATALISALSVVSAAAQDGANDPTFHTLDDGMFGSGAAGASSYSAVQTGVIQPDGRVWIAGGFSLLHGSPRPAIARVDVDGAYDSSFSPGAGVTGLGNPYYVQAARRQPDGRVLIAGRFDHYDGQPRSNVARVLANGAVDPSFVPPTLGILNAMALQPDGRVIVAGQFSIVEGERRAQLARLNADGTLDLSFNPGEGPGGVPEPEVSAVEVQPDGRILVGGHFRRMNGVTRWRIARLMPDGSLDASFDPGTGFDSYVSALAVQPDGAVIVAGDFFSINGTSAMHLARLLSTGAVDPLFNAGAGTNYAAGFVRLQPDGKALIGGPFTTCGGAPRAGIARLNTDGSNDASFDPGLGLVGTPRDALPLGNGQHILVGNFTRVDGAARGGFARLNADGSHDLTYNPGRGPDAAVRAAAVRPDGKWLIAGEFLSYDDIPCNRIARLNADGSFDTSFTPGGGPNGSITRIRMLPDGGAFVVGTFSLYDGLARRTFAKVDAQGALDMSFDPGTGVLGHVQDLLVQRDGKVVIAGFFTQYNGVATKCVARLLPDGQLDPSFNVGAGSPGVVQHLARQPDGKLLVYGAFSEFNGVPRERIARLNPDGSVDLSFDVGFGPSGYVQAMVVEANGTILIGGSFTHFDGLFRPSLVRLLSDGSVDPAGFAVPNTGSNVVGIEPQLDSSVLLHGAFSSINGVQRRGIARAFQNGTLDASFDPGSGTDGFIFASARQPGGDLLVAGSFTQYDGAVRHRIARVKLAWLDWVNYCTAGVSSTGCVPSVSASGSASVGATSGFTLSVQNVDGNRQGLVFYALGGRVSVPLAPTSSSSYCVLGPVQRTAVQGSGGTPGACNGSLQLDWLDYVANHPGAVGAPFHAGVRVQAQGWYRDPAAPKGVTLSDALEFITVP